MADKLTPASLDSIRAEILVSLKTLSTAEGGPAEHVDMYNGEITRAEGINTATLGATTALLLAFEGEAQEQRRDVQTIAKKRPRRIGRSIWRVYVAVQRLDGAEGEMSGDDQNAGMMALTDAVHTALTGLAIPGLLQGEDLDFIGQVPHLLEPGRALVYLMRFAASRPLPQAKRDYNPRVVPLQTVRADLQTSEDDEADRLDLTTVDADALDA